MSAPKSAMKKPVSLGEPCAPAAVHAKKGRVSFGPDVVGIVPTNTEMIKSGTDFWIIVMVWKPAPLKREVGFYILRTMPMVA